MAKSSVISFIQSIVLSIEIMQNRSVPEDKLAKTLQLTSSACAIGGIILAANIPAMSKYGLIFLSLSSGQMPIASLRNKDVQMIIYSESLFFFVECLVFIMNYINTDRLFL